MTSDIPNLLTSILGEIVILERKGLEFEVFGVVKNSLQNYGLDENERQILIDGLFVSIAADELPFDITSQDRLTVRDRLYDIDFVHKSANGMYKLSLSVADIDSESDEEE